jgi:predicted nucleotidyltransferase
MADALDKLKMPKALREAVREALARLVELAQPEVVILFGSWAEGTARPDSDVDLVVVARTEDRRQLARELYHLWHEQRRALAALPTADILVYTPRQFDEGFLVGFPAYQATRHGVVIHGALPKCCADVAA